MPISLHPSSCRQAAALTGSTRYQAILPSASNRAWRGAAWKKLGAAANDRREPKVGGAWCSRSARSAWPAQFVMERRCRLAQIAKRVLVGWRRFAQSTEDSPTAPTCLRLSLGTWPLLARSCSCAGTVMRREGAADFPFFGCRCVTFVAVDRFPASRTENTSAQAC